MKGCGHKENPRPQWVVISLGSNLGNSLGNFQKVIPMLNPDGPDPTRVSSLWRSEPVDCPPGSPLFLNAAVAWPVRPGESPEALLEKLQGLERSFGRTVKKTLNEPRSLDLDLIAFGGEMRQTPALTLPHPRAHLRQFVLGPLAEILPGLVLPGQQRTVSQLLSDLHGPGSAVPIGPLSIGSSNG